MILHIRNGLPNGTARSPGSDQEISRLTVAKAETTLSPLSERGADVGECIHSRSGALKLPYCPTPVAVLSNRNRDS